MDMSMPMTRLINRHADADTDGVEKRHGQASAAERTAKTL
jgi:hypothetical protein